MSLSNGRGGPSQTIKSPSIIQQGTESQLYITDKNTSKLWFIFGSSGPWGQLKITANNHQNTVRPEITVCKDSKDCQGPSCVVNVRRTSSDQCATKTWRGRLMKKSNTFWKIGYLR